MKILMTSDTYLPRYGGGEYHVHYLARELRKEGHNVTLMTTENDAWDGDSEHPVVRHAYKGVKSLPAIFQLLWKLSNGVDLIHGHYSYRLSWVAATVAFLRGIPFVVTQHGLGLLPQVETGLAQQLTFRMWRWWSMKVARVVISTSDDLSLDIRALGFGQKIVSIPNGYDAEKFLPLNPPSGSPTLLAVRRHVPKNGLQYLVAALPQLVARFPDLRLDLVGDGRLQDELRMRAQKLGVEQHVRFLGALSHAEVIERYKQAHVVVIPSTAESTSLTCIEAMAQRKVIVASRVGGLIELLGKDQERGYLVDLTGDEHCNYDAPMDIPAERITALADAIAQALTDSGEAYQKADAASGYAKKNYAWSMIAQRTSAEAYRPCLDFSSHS